MSVPTAHKILIGTSIVFFAFFALWELRDYTASGDRATLVWSAAAAAGALGLASYLRRYVRTLGQP